MAVVAAAVLGVALWAPSARAAELLLGADGGSGYPADLLVIDPQTGKVTERIGPVGYSITGLAVDPTTGTLYGVTGNADITNPSFLVRIDPHTGAGTLVGDEIPTSDTGAADITFRSDGTLFGWSEDTDDLVTINKDTGLATIVGEAAHSTAGSGLAFDSAGTLWFAGDDDNGPLSNVNPATSAVTPVITMDGFGWQISALAFNGAGTLFGSRIVTTGPRAADLITIDRTTGRITSTRNQILRLDGLVFFNSSPRSITLAANKKKVKEGKNVVLSGTVASPDAACASGQTVTVNGGALGTVATAFTAADGFYSAKLPVTKQTTFQATVDTTAVCDDATSAPVTVKLKGKGKKK